MRRIFVLACSLIIGAFWLAINLNSAKAVDYVSFYNRDSEQCLTGKVSLIHMTTQQCNFEFKIQQFEVNIVGISNNGNDIVTFRKNGSNLCVRTPGISDYTNVTQEQCHHNWPSFQWEVIPSGVTIPNPFIPDDVEVLYLVSVNSEKCMTDTLGNDNVVIRPCNNWATQQWMPTP